MSSSEEPPAAPTRRRAPWSFKHLVEDVSGRPLADFQEPPPRSAGSSEATLVGRSAGAPDRRTGAAPRASADPAAVALPAAATEAMDEPPDDPVARIYPPLSGSMARALHGADAEHHAPTLRSVEGPNEPPGPGDRLHRPGPSRRPERIYLHYLLLHLDRLNDAGLRYLKHAVDEELAHRDRTTPGAAASADAPAPTAPGPAEPPSVDPPGTSPPADVTVPGVPAVSPPEGLSAPPPTP